MAAQPPPSAFFQALLSLGERRPIALRSADLCCQQLSEKVTFREGCLSDLESDQWQQVCSLLADLVTQKSLGALKLTSALALHSWTFNQALARQQPLIHALVTCLAEADSLDILTACATAFSDLAITEEGTRALLMQEALPTLLDRLVKLATVDSVLPRGKKRRKSPKLATSVTLLGVLFALLLSDAGPAIGELPRVKSSLVLTALCRLARDHESAESLSKKQKGELYAVIGRLSLEWKEPYVSSLEQNRDDVSFEDLVDFGPGGLEAFLQSRWEKEPFLFPNKHSILDSSKVGGSSSALSNIEGLRNPDEIFDVLLKRAVGCPSPVADETNVIKSLKEFSAELGGPLIYGQDVTIVKTAEGKLSHFEQEKEEHAASTYEGSSSSLSTKIAEAHNSRPPPSKRPKKAQLRVVTSQEWKAGFMRGFSIAIRGLQYRIPEIARLSEAFANALGQASIGVNAYLTPPNSQGLAAHYDDHCVVVCQLAGNKLWTVYEPSDGERMPRLYAPKREPDLAGRSFREYRLEKGDALYIPRGWTHLAEAMDETSLHVTFGVEIEEPFSWEGFLQTAISAASSSDSTQQEEASENLSPKASLAQVEAFGSKRKVPCSPHRESQPAPKTLSLRATAEALPRALQKTDGTSSTNSDALLTSNLPHHPHRCREVIRWLADQLPVLRKACLIGAVSRGSERDALSSSEVTSRVKDILAEITRGAQIVLGSPTVEDMRSEVAAEVLEKGGLCIGCLESALSESTALQYLSKLRKYQSARKRWNQAMLAVQNVQLS